MALIITDTGKAKELADELIKNSASAEDFIATIDNVLSILGLNWGESQADAQSYRELLTKERDFLQRSATCNTEFAQGIKEYVELTEMASNKNASGV